MMPKMILIWGFRDFGEGLIPDMHERELEKKIQVLFLINWEEGGGFGLLSLCHLAMHVQVMCFIFPCHLTVKLMAGCKV